MPPRSRSRKPREVREPLQVYLDRSDRSLLDAMAAQTDAPRSDVIRQALRRLAIDVLGDARPGSSFAALVGSLDAAPDVPADLSARHDEYLYADLPAPRRRRAPKA
jgi:uncharacterized protein (DUF1778 family)